MPSWEPPYPTPHWRLRKFFSQPTNWEPPRPVLVYGHTYALTDEVREKFPSSGLHLIPREEPGDLVVPEFTGYEDPREAEKWITAFCEWTLMNGMSQGLCQELLAEYIKRALRHIPHHPLMKKTFESWEDLLRDFFLDMKIRGLEKYKTWYWLKRKDVPIIWFSHTELKLATNYFDSSFIVGESDTSRLIKGFMHGNIPVVVKRLKKVVDASIQKVLNEINVHRYLTKGYHGDVCRLLGYSTRAEDPLLVYEYIPNGNLREHMQERYGYGDYIWQNAPCRLAILIDIASGIGELHYNSKLPVYHRDIQPSNILLDKNYRAKICDFGDAVVIKSEEDRHKHPVCGALGYLDPVFRATGRCDDKTDVYSLGVIMLELATKLKAWDPFRQSKYGMNPFLLGFMMERMKDGTAEEYLRPGRAYYIGTPHNMEGTAIVVELVRVALWCCCPELRLRPRADQVAAVLLQIQSRWVTPGLRAIQQTTEGGVMPTLAGQQDDIPLGEKRPPEREKPVFFMKLPESAVKLEPQAVKKLQTNLEALQRNDPPKVLPVGKGQVEPQSQAPETPLGKDQPKQATQNQPKTPAGKQPPTDQPKTSPPPAKDQQKIPAGKKTAKEGKISRLTRLDPSLRERVSTDLDD